MSCGFENNSRILARSTRQFLNMIFRLFWLCSKCTTNMFLAGVPRPAGRNLEEVLQLIWPCWAGFAPGRVLTHRPRHQSSRFQTLPRDNGVHAASSLMVMVTVTVTATVKVTVMVMVMVMVLMMMVMVVMVVVLVLLQMK